MSSKFYTEPLPLAGIFELVKTENENIEIHNIEKLERFHTLYHSYLSKFFNPEFRIDGMAF